VDHKTFREILFQNEVYLNEIKLVVIKDPLITTSNVFTQTFKKKTKKTLEEKLPITTQIFKHIFQ
jgi:hypothetical protein